MKRIFIPVDFSPHSLRAAAFGINVARTLGGSCLFYHALGKAKTEFSKIPAYDYMGAGQAYETELTDIIASFDEKLKMLSHQLGGHEFQNLCQHLVSVDTTTTGIVKYAEFRGVDLIVMGTTGNTQRDRTHIGSNTSSVISRTNIPVLAIPSQSDTQKITHILFATDFEDTDIESLKKLTFFATGFNACISVVHVDLKADPQMAKIVFNDYKEKIEKEVPFGCYTFHLLEGSDVLGALNKYIEDTKVDLIAMATKKKNLFDSIYQQGLTRQMLFHTRIPLLAFHAYDLPGETYF